MYPLLELLAFYIMKMKPVKKPKKPVDPIKAILKRDKEVIKRFKERRVAASQKKIEKITQERLQELPNLNK